MEIIKEIHKFKYLLREIIKEILKIKCIMDMDPLKSIM